MPAALIPKSEVLDRLLSTFRQQGYDGASLADLSEVTGLGKSSLYHYFPGGKEDMALQVLGHLESELEAGLYASLRSDAAPPKRLDAMLAALDDFYDGGKRACLLERLAASVDRRRFRRPLAQAFETWIEAVETLLRQAGIPKKEARRRAEDLVVRIEGALVVAAGTQSPAIFERTLADARAWLLA